MSPEAPSLTTRARVCLRAMGRILRHRWPDYDFNDLAAVQDTLDGPAFARAARMMAKDPDGRALLAARPALGVHNTDWEALRHLPTESFGYNIWHHFHDNGFMGGFELEPPLVTFGPDAEFAKDRYRATHDVRHVLTGVGVEGYEEVVLQTFQCAQLPQILSVLIMVFGGIKHALIDGQGRALLRAMPRAWRAGRRARFLLHMPVEQLFALPLAEVRRMYRLDPVGEAYPVHQRHPDAAPAAAA